ncbi:putative tape measure chaperone [Hafnia phage vB_HpaM_SarahDanielle]|uniref:Tape measure chaperone n=2 Tax=Daniellevirus TaxID=3425110 RepID=A0AAE7WAY3_9CAUD|nr:putative tape measure chaperone [Hafnia phage vB_HpaM_SarahDanielle]
MKRTYEGDPLMGVILSVYSDENCKETLSELLNMPFTDFIQLREFLEVQASYREESQFNQLRQAKKR